MITHTHVTGDGVKHETLEAALCHASLIHNTTRAIISVEAIVDAAPAVTVLRWSPPIWGFNLEQGDKQ